jgi:hypothetical protein
MNLQDAIRSDKSFRRKGTGLWLQVVGGKIFAMNAMNSYVNTTEDILADDWEIEEDKPTVITILDVEGVGLRFGWSLENEFIINSEYEFDKEALDKILTFLYNNTEIGKSRIIPF